MAIVTLKTTAYSATQPAKVQSLKHDNKAFVPAIVQGNSSRFDPDDAKRNRQRFDSEVQRYASIPTLANIDVLRSILNRGEKDVKGGRKHKLAMTQAHARISKLDWVLTNLTTDGFINVKEK